MTSSQASPHGPFSVHSTQRPNSFRDRLALILAALTTAVVLTMLMAPSADAASPAAETVTYVVKAGDTLGRIAARYGVSVASLVRTNGIRNPDRIYIGQQLVISGSSAAPATQPSTAPASPTGSIYIVQRGDTLSRIAARFGSTVSALAARNGLANPNLIWVGQRLSIGGGSSAPSAPSAPDAASAGRWIDIDLSDQRLTAYEGNKSVFSALISGGLPRTPTVTGKFRVYSKLVSTRMSGPGYDLPGVPYTMYFYKGYAIHGTYWHNNFGHPMSHGCVNMRTQDAAWLFNWASVGTLVVSHQ